MERCTSAHFTLIGGKNTGRDFFPDTLAEGEFNPYYCGALRRRAMDEHLRVGAYRAKETENPRSTSEGMIGKELDLAAGPNSGLSPSLPRRS